MKKNFAAILSRQKKRLDVINLNIPNPPKGYVLVKLKYSGICHTQLNEISGMLGKDKYLPHCMGHEGTGTVIKIGKDVKKFKVNDKVAISWIKNSKSKKFQSINFLNKMKKINSGGCNTLMNFSLVTEDKLYKLSKKNHYLRESILLGCAIPTAANAILNIAKVSKNSKILIMGMGGLGYSSLIILNYLKCKKVTCIDKNNKRLSVLKNINNFEFINTKSNSVMMNFLLNNKDNFDLILDCTGSKSLIESTFGLCKKFSGKLIVIGNTKINEKLSIKAWDIIFGKTLTGAWGKGGPLMKNFDLIEKILLDQIKIVRKILPKFNYRIININKAIKDFKLGKVLRPVIKF